MKDLNEFEAGNNATRRRARRKGIRVKVGNVTIPIYFDADADTQRGHKPYRVVWIAADGTRHSEMFGSIDEAKTFAEKTATDLNNGQRPYDKSEIDKLFQLEAKVRQWTEHPASLGRTLDQVIADVLAATQLLPGWTCSQMANEIRQRHATIKNYLLVKDVVEAFLKHMQGGYKRSYSKNYVTQFKFMLRRFTAQFGSRRLDLISPKEIQDYIGAMRVVPRSRHSADIPRDKDGLIPATPKTKEALFNCLAALFRYARDLLQALPAEERTAVERAGRPDQKASLPQIYLPGDLVALFGVLPDIEMVLFVAVQVYAGLRPCEVRDLTDEDIVTDENGVPTTILVRHHIAKKNAGPNEQIRTRKAPITPPLAALLKLITLPKGKLFLRGNMQSYALEYLRQAGVVAKHDGFRHSFVSYRLEIVKDRGQVALEAGHGTDVQFDSYEGLVLPKNVKPYWSFVPSIAGLTWHVHLPEVTTLRRRREAQKKASSNSNE